MSRLPCFMQMAMINGHAPEHGGLWRAERESDASCHRHTRK